MTCAHKNNNNHALNKNVSKDKIYLIHSHHYSYVHVRSYMYEHTIGYNMYDHIKRIIIIITHLHYVSSCYNYIVDGWHSYILTRPILLCQVALENTQPLG